MNWKDRYLYPVITPVLKTGLWLMSRSRLPGVNGNLRIKGLQEPVEVLRDKWGVPHIYAQNTRDVLLAQGFIHAQERLWQMDFSRRVVFGRLSEVLGESALPVDRAMRTLGMFRTAEKEAAVLPDSLREMLDAYCQGINAWMEMAIKKKKLPIEFVLLGYKPELWRMADSLAWGKMMSWTLEANWQSELYRMLLLEKLGANKVADLEIDIDKAWAVILDVGLAMGAGKVADATRPFGGARVGEGVGSNNWVIHGSRTNTGKPLLANDMHLELTTPGIWIENHLCGGELNVTGVSLPGVPLVIAGHNSHLAWGMTDSCPDMQDLYEEHLRAEKDGGWEYEFKGEWLPAEVHKEKIHVKSGKTVTEDVVETKHGPIINYLFKDAFPNVHPMALCWTALQPDVSFQAIYTMNIARNCGEFHQALREFANPSQNNVYADIQGNIGYTMNGRIPIRAKGDGSVPAPGWTGEYEWKGYLSLEQLPHMVNPPAGYVATANNQIQRPDYPHFLGKDYLVSERSGRIKELIHSKEKLDIAFIQSMQYDQVGISARLMGKALGNLKVKDSELQQIVDQMREWNGNLDANSFQACIFETTIRQAASIIISHHMGSLGMRARGKGPFAGQWPDHLWDWFVRLLDQPKSTWFDLGKGETRDEVLVLALRKAVNYLKAELGPDMLNWKWGKLHKLTFGHVLGLQKPLDRIFCLGPFPIGGDGTTICASFSSFSDLEPRPIVGPPYRFIADLNDLDHCWSVLAPGQSGNLSSHHYSDGVLPWFEGTYHPVLFRRDEIEKNLEGKMILNLG
jgi:penicillin amidase